MDGAETCFFCGRTSPETDLVAWFVEHGRRTTHTACWVDAYRSKRLDVGSSAEPAPPIEARRAEQARRMTLDDIRRDLEAEYPTASHAAETRGSLAVDDIVVVEHHRSASRRLPRRRRYAMALLGSIAGAVLLFVTHAAVTGGMIPLGAVVSARDVPGSNAPGASPTVDEHRRPAHAQPTAAVPPLALITELDRQVKALRSDLQALAARLEGSDSRIARMETRVSGVESSMRRLADDVAAAAAIRAAERPVAEPRQTARRSVPVAPRPPAPAPATVADPQPRMPAKHSENESSPPSDVPPVVETVSPPEPQTASTTIPGVAPNRGGSAASDNASRSSELPTLREKLRADWRTIKQGFASAGDELKANLRDVGRKLTRE